MKEFKHTVITILVLMFLHNCSETTKPEDDTPRNPRDYTWTIMDSLSVPGTLQISMNDIWGSSANDIYVVGNSNGGTGKMYHFDGKTWQRVKLHILEGGNIPNIRELWSIHGFSSDNIYVAGYKIGDGPGDELSLFLHYDGQQWTEIPSDSKGLMAVWGNTDKNIWTGGKGNELLNYKNGQWISYATPDSVWFKSIAGFSDSDVYAAAYKVGKYGRLTHYMYHWNGRTWSMQDSFTEPESERFSIYKLQVIENKMYSNYFDVFEKESCDSVWTKIFESSTTMLGLSGTSTNNIFIVGSGGKAYHYNGTDWYQYKDIEYVNLKYTTCWADEKQVFIIGYDGKKSVVLHGK